MVMKDKLIKFGHKRGYYFARETFIGFIAVVCLFSAVAIPTYIASNTNTVRSQEVKDNDDNKTDNFLSVLDIK